LTLGSQILANQWYFVSGTYDGNFMTLYLDGIELGSVSQSGNLCDNDEGWTIGAGRYDSPDRHFKGSIDEVRIYNRSLSATEIQNLYELGSYHINWSDWQSRTNNTVNGSFYQYNLSLVSDSVNVSPYVHNVSVYSGVSS